MDSSVPSLSTDVSLTGVPVRAIHLTQLRTAVNAMRAAAGLPAFVFTDPALVPGTAVKRLHVTELRSALDAARATIGLPALAYTDSTITAGSTPIRAAPITELRGGTR
jgi:hypothetical protein